MKYVKETKRYGIVLDDKQILEDMDKAKKFYENGAIVEAKCVIYYINEALDYFCKNA